MQIFISHQNQQLGPFTPAQVQAGLAAGHFSTADLAWHEGLTGWLPLERIVAALPGSTAVPQMTLPSMPDYSRAPTGSDYSNPYAYDSKAAPLARSGTAPWSPIAVVSLVMGILAIPAWIGLLIFAGLHADGADEESPEMIAVGLGAILLLLLNLTGGGLGIGGLVSQCSNWWMGLTGTLLNGLTLAGIIGLMILGAMLS